MSNINGLDPKPDWRAHLGLLANHVLAERDEKAKQAEKQKQAERQKQAEEEKSKAAEDSLLADIEAAARAEYMAQTTGPGNENSDAGRPYHDKIAQDLRNMLARRQQLERNLTAIEDRIYAAETEYIESTPNGNMLTGFDNYIKGGSGANAARRKTAISDADRVFSSSSISFKTPVDSPAPSAHSTPAPTPVNTSLAKESSSNHPTPTSATSGPKAAGGSKKVTKKAGEESEGEGKDPKKARTNFGATRK